MTIRKQNKTEPKSTERKRKNQSFQINKTRRNKLMQTEPFFFTKNDTKT